ncbi:Fic family protein [Flavobacterium sp. J372]|uniref:Fic family protein n=1 Tax=Flavobacterium sp. J372 TaxID=2898436 RepID=UPI0021510DA5|nr:Fic family protein [Flavobacterium sp. J372]MCR5861053.1 Fic family protein [Flavobacterium sp. J372]
MEEILKALELKQQLDNLRPLEKEQEARIMQKFRLDWNYHSNNLEGNSLTYGETKALILFGVTAQGKPLKDHFEVTGHNEAINWVLEILQGDRPLNESFIRDVHKLLLKESYEVDAQTPDGKPTKKKVIVGDYKKMPNHVLTKTGEMFYFATPEETPSKMGDLMAWYNEKIAEADINPILLAAEFHYKFIRIHPFDDGNGRTARILMNFILMKFGYPPVIIKTEDKENYYAVLRLADADNLEPFIDYIAQNLNRSLEIMIAGAKGESIEEPDDIDKEIALLEKRLHSLGQSSKIGKSRNSVLFTIDQVIKKINDRTLDKNSKLSKFYLKLHSVLKISTNPIIDLDFDNIKTMNVENFKAISIKILFQKFSLVGYEDFDFEMLFYFKLLPTYYEIHANGVFVGMKPYGIKLTDLEVDEIINPELKRHKDFIEQKIAEKEKEL